MASIKQFGERKDNISSIISFIRRKGDTTRMEICKGLALSWACVSKLVALLIEEGILIESASVTTETSLQSKGRTPTHLSLNEKKYFLGVDINDSGIAITTLSMNGKTIAARKWEAECFLDKNELERSVCDKIAEMLGNKEDCCGIGVASEGRRSEDGGYRYPMAGGTVLIFPQEFISNRFGLPVSVRHDPECVLYSVAHSDKDRFVVRVDKWIGVAAMKQGKILDLPLELGWIRYENRKLHHILQDCAKAGDYRKIAEALGHSAGNLALLLGIETCVLAGEVSKWLDGITDLFDAALRQVSDQIEYEICLLPDASDGAARLAMAEYPPVKKQNEGYEVLR